MIRALKKIDVGLEETAEVGWERLPQGSSVRKNQLWKPLREEHSRQEK